MLPLLIVVDRVLRGVIFLQNMNSGASVVRRIVGLLSRRLQSLPDDAITTGQDIVMIMLGGFRTQGLANICSRLSYALFLML